MHAIPLPISIIAKLNRTCNVECDVLRVAHLLRVRGSVNLLEDISLRACDTKKPSGCVLVHGYFGTNCTNDWVGRACELVIFGT